MHTTRTDSWLAVGNELIDVIDKIPKANKNKLISNIKEAICTIKYNPTLPIHAVSSPPTTEDELAETEGGVGSKHFTHTLAITIANNLIAPRVFIEKNKNAPDENKE